MGRYGVAVVCVGICAGAGDAAWAEATAGGWEAADPAGAASAKPKSPTPLDGIWRNTVDSFWGWNLTYHLTAVAETALFSPTNGDSAVRTGFHNHPNCGQAAWPGYILGFAGSAGVIGGFWVTGAVNHDSDLVAAAFAVGQANVITGLYVGLLKLITGRPRPEDSAIPKKASDVEGLSRTFRWGFARDGLVSSWPSGHVAFITTTCAALVGYYPDSLALKLTEAGATAYMIFSVAAFRAGGMHWFSDALAGALVAHPIGYWVGQGFRRGRQGLAKRDESAWMIIPAVSPGLTLVTMARAF
jgi:membrane-associated phospholipid phosphatase